MTPRLIIHGGAGRAMRDPERAPIVKAALHAVVRAVYDELQLGMSAREAAVLGCKLLEDDPNFNAGTGSVLQSDGQVRMSAALMDGDRRAFSGAINVMRIQNAIALAEHLNDYPDRVLDAQGAQELARELNLPIYDPATEKRLTEWLAERQRGFGSSPADVVAEDREDDRRKGTIGVCALDAQGRLAAGTSTGGRGFERLGRVSDSAMPASTYATDEAAVSCTGVGEDIMDECLAARVVIRVTDGMNLDAAMEKSMHEGVANQRIFGAIGVSRDGALVWGKTSDLLLAAWHDGAKIKDSVDVEAAARYARVDAR